MNKGGVFVNELIEEDLLIEARYLRINREVFGNELRRIYE